MIGIPVKCIALSKKLGAETILSFDVFRSCNESIYCDIFLSKKKLKDIE